MSTASIHPPCEEIITLTEKVSQLETREKVRDADIQRLLGLASKIELLMSLSIGGGGLSLFTLVVTVVQMIVLGK